VVSFHVFSIALSETPPDAATDTAASGVAHIPQKVDLANGVTCERALSDIKLVKSWGGDGRDGEDLKQPAHNQPVAYLLAKGDPQESQHGISREKRSFIASRNAVHSR
jgi:hypothetical protein